MAQKLLKHELVERLLQLKEKQDVLTVQMQLLTQEISELAAPFVPKTPKSRKFTSQANNIGKQVGKSAKICQKKCP
ncbi:hypothetical protein [Actinobacillus porcinus]|uniref:hypothetical protein n=1 Tax=Actinobacillus porcinus TaxID=51048 RepID=UPI002A911F55|nr:hypothetical protein [Actinobacillus porcinus]MDY6216768.1 hypothetical protein [Actinobacillus porcinus]